MLIGVLGGGQLGRMLALAGYPLGMRFRLFDPAPDAPAGHLAEHIAAAYDDTATLDRFLEGVDVVTYEFENVPVETARYINERVPVYPPPEALLMSQDRLTEKTFFRDLGIPTAPFVEVNSREDLQAALEEIRYPAVLKTRRFGYDGKGQEVISAEEHADPTWEALGAGEHPLILEGFVPFSRELSVLATRSGDGSTAFYPLVENHHRGGILRLSLPNSRVTPELQATAEDYAVRVLEQLDYVGMLAIELFEVEGNLIANEMAPRVHNSGHWTIEGAETSQFENHIRAIAGLPLGSSAPVGRSVMFNLIGSLPDAAKILAVPGAHLHLYGKDPRPGRKLGHITLRTADAQRLSKWMQEILDLVEGA
jgi:5-(carboxyamino)imidazole ribonucleotide synthase